MISSIKIPVGEYSSVGKSGEDLDYISELSKVNIFVGANNSGKSRFMRAILSNQLNYAPKEINLLEISTKINALKKEIVDYLERMRLLRNDALGIGNIVNKFEDISYLNKNSNFFNFILSLEKKIEEISLQRDTTSNGFLNSEIGRELQKIFNKYIDNSVKKDLEVLKSTKFKLVYIPILRGLRSLVHKSEEETKNSSPTPYSTYWDCYTNRTIFDYFNNPKENSKQMSGYIESFNNGLSKELDLEIFTGMSLYEEVKRMLLGAPDGREFILSFQKFLGENFFGGQKITLIPNINNDVLYIQIGNEERPIYDLGDGLQTIIISLFPLFKYKEENLLLFIEEPELTLHPGMQRKLINAYCKEEFPNSQIFITTHSNHLLDLTLDFENKTSIYSFEKKDSGKFKIRYTSPDKEILDLLGVRSSSVFLSNCIIWVEGVSDRLYIQKFLERYKKSNPSFIYEEDRHYSIVEYGGGNLVHFNFDCDSTECNKIRIDLINKNNFLIADNDTRIDYKSPINEALDDEKLKRLKSLHLMLRDKFFAEHIEIENLIPYKAFKEYFTNLEENSNRKWKYDSSKENQTLFEQEINIKKIGEILRERFISLKNASDAGKDFNKKGIDCIGDKKEMAERLLPEIEKIPFENLTPTAKNLTIKLTEFIQENNN